MAKCIWIWKGNVSRICFIFHFQLSTSRFRLSTSHFLFLLFTFYFLFSSSVFFLFSVSALYFLRPTPYSLLLTLYSSLSAFYFSLPLPAFYYSSRCREFVCFNDVLWRRGGDVYGGVRFSCFLICWVDD